VAGLLAAAAIATPAVSRTVAAQTPIGEPQQAETTYGAPGTIDFIQYWTSGRLLLEGVNPYDASAVGSRERALGVVGEVSLLRGPPWTLFLLLPFLLLPFGLAAQLWLIVNVLLVSVSLIALHSALGAGRRSLLASAVATACFYPVFQSLILGQVSVVLLVCLAGFMLAESRARPFLAGVFLAPLTIKPHLFLVFGAILLWRVLREKRTRVLYGTGAGLVLLLLPVVLLVPASFGQWLGSFSSASAATGVVPIETWKTTTLTGLLRSLIFSISGSAPMWPLWVLPPLGLLAASAWIRRSGLGLGLAEQTPMLLCLSYLFAPYGWVFDQAILLPLQIAMVSQAFERGRPRVSRFGVLAVLIGIQLVAILIGLREGVTLHEFFWIPLAMMGVWFWHSRRMDTKLQAAQALIAQSKAQGANE
jgi:hypothetical protein